MYEILKKLSEIYSLNGDDIRAFTYYKAWYNLTNDIKNGIGKSVNEWLNNKKKLPKIEKKISMKHLKYLNDNDIEDFREKYINNKIKLNKYELILLNYYDFLKNGIKKEEIDDIKSNINIKNSKILGSYIRGKEKSSDIDILIYGYKNINNIINKINKKYPIVLTIQKSENKFMGLIKYKKKFVHIDIINVKKTELIPSILYFTGPKLFNIMIRNIAKKKGYKLNRYGLFKNNKSIKLTKEKDIFDILNIKYVPPNQR